MSLDERTVHGTGYDGAHYEVVRYDRAGKWYIEYKRPMIPSRHVSVRDAVKASQVKYLGLPGGGAFDRIARKASQ